jgi:DNA-binding XRE family transcriptional regulator
MNLSQEKLAEKAGISRVTLSEIENGKAEPESSTVVKLVKATGKPANQIFFDFDVV